MGANDEPGKLPIVHPTESQMKDQVDVQELALTGSPPLNIHHRKAALQNMLPATHSRYWKLYICLTALQTESRFSFNSL